jgi:hypothetical protein
MKLQIVWIDLGSPFSNHLFARDDDIRRVDFEIDQFDATQVRTVSSFDPARHIAKEILHNECMNSPVIAE